MMTTPVEVDPRLAERCMTLFTTVAQAATVARDRYVAAPTVHARALAREAWVEAIDAAERAVTELVDEAPQLRELMAPLLASNARTRSRLREESAYPLSAGPVGVA